MVLAKRAFQLFEARYGWYNPIRSVTIQAINLIPQDTPRQIGLFMDVEKQEKLEGQHKERSSESGLAATTGKSGNHDADGNGRLRRT